MSFKKVGVTAMLVFFIAGCGNQYMRKPAACPEIKADQSKATLVIYRTTSFGWVKEIHNYLDKAYIGTTKGKCFFATKVDPGSHYVIADAENKACAKINFEAGKVYYLCQSIFIGVWSARTGFTPGTLKEFEEQQKEMDCLIVNTEEKAPVLGDKDYKETVADFEKEEKEDPKKHEDTDHLQGF
ncbi:MAG TPA: hypothetical protein VLX68_09635 [Chitinivibrionales bacterium]|nr:hypothetical protein [Chitinivibrionales bacterium]